MDTGKSEPENRYPYHQRKKEKLMAIEAIWEDLLLSKEEIESPRWHQEALKETEERFASGRSKNQLIGNEQRKVKERIHSRPVGLLKEKQV